VPGYLFPASSDKVRVSHHGFLADRTGRAAEAQELMCSFLACLESIQCSNALKELFDGSLLQRSCLMGVLYWFSTSKQPTYGLRSAQSSLYEPISQPGSQSATFCVCSNVTQTSLKKLDDELSACHRAGLMDVRKVRRTGREHGY